MVDFTTKSIKQRVEDQLEADLRDRLNLAVKDVQWADLEQGNQAQADAAGNMPDAWLLLSSGEEDQLGPEDERAAIRHETQILPVTVDAHLLRLPPDFETWRGYANAWVAALKAAVMANPYRTDSGGTELAMDTRVVGSFPLIPVEGQRDRVCGIELEIDYRHNLADPYTV